MVKYITAIPNEIRFRWEVEVLVSNLSRIDPATPVVVVLLGEDGPMTGYLEKKYGNVEVSYFDDTREYNSYVATVKPYLIYRYLLEDPSREKDTYFQIDSDVIFREKVDFKLFKGKNTVYGSDCASYMDWNYLKQKKQGEALARGMAEIVGIPFDELKKIEGIGAQYFIPRPTADMWYDIWSDSVSIDRFLSTADSDIQAWAAEMWAELYNLHKHGYKVKIHKELDFCWIDNKVEEFYKTKIMHNTGTTKDGNFFVKGDWRFREPFKEDLSWVRTDRCTIKYVEELQRVVV